MLWNYYSNTVHLREKMALAIIFRKNIKIINIRKNKKNKGLQNFEIDILSLIDKFIRGSIIKINEGGTVVVFYPGKIENRKINHRIQSLRPISYYLEFILYILLISKNRNEVKLLGIRSLNLDTSFENVLYVTIPLLRKFGLQNIRFKIFSNTSSSLINTELVLFFPIMKINDKTLHLINLGIVNKIRIINTYVSKNAWKKKNVEDFFTKFALPHGFNLKILDLKINNKYFNFQTLSLIAETTQGCIFGEDITSYYKKYKSIDWKDVLSKLIVSFFDDIIAGNCIDKKNHIFLFLNMLYRMLAGKKYTIPIVCLGKLSISDIKFFRDLKKLTGFFFLIRYHVLARLYTLKLP